MKLQNSRLQMASFLVLSVLAATFFAALLSPYSVQAQTPNQRKEQLKNLGSCGTVATRDHNDYAGLIVVLGAKPYHKQVVAINEGQRGNGAKVEVSNHGDPQSPPAPKGNVVKLGNGPEGVAERYSSHTFSSRDIRGEHANCTGQLVLPGHGNGNWAIDCDVSQRQGGINNPQPINVQGKGTPYVHGKKLRAGGNWTTDLVAPPNGKHLVAITTYHEPPPDDGWKLTPRTRVNLRKVHFPRQDVPAGPDTRPSRPSVSKPSGYSRGMDCVAVYGSEHPDARDRCREWNRYYNQLDRYNARKDAEDHNRAAARQALNRVHFTHKVGNTSKNGQHDWGVAPNNRNKHEWTIWYRVIAPGRSVTNWATRYGNGDPVSRRLAPDVWKRHPKSATNVPGATSSNGLKPMLDDPKIGDRYCEQIRVKPSSSTGGGMRHDQDCVTLAPGDDRVCEPWQVHGSTYLAGPRDPNGAWVGDTFTAHYSFWKTGSADNTAAINFYHNGGSAATLALGSWSPAYNIGPFSAQDGGRTFSDIMTYTPTYSAPINDCGTAGNGQQGPSYVHVPWFYQLHPQVNINNDTPQIVQQGTPAKIDPLVVLNSIDTARSLTRYNTCADQFDWQLRVTIQRPDTPTVKEPLSSYDRNGHKGPRAICPNGNPGSAQLLQSGPTVNTAVLPAGAKLCGQLTITKSTENSGSPASIEKCTIIVKAPKVQFWNSDVNTGRHFQQADNNPTCGEPLASALNASITTSGAPTSVGSQNLYGSWVEYGVFASGGISSFGSAAENKAGGYSFDPRGQRLTFSNDGQLGGFAYSNWCIPSYQKLYEQKHEQTNTSLVGNVNLASLASKHYYTDNSANITLGNISGISAGSKDITINAPNGNVTLNGGTIKKGVRLVIHARGTVKINGNLQYANGYANINQIPRVVIIADGAFIAGGGSQRGIVIKDGVTHLDPWLITRQGLYTCSTNPDVITYSLHTCDKQLFINEPVAANALHLRRTFGADLTKPLNERGPAEVFNLNPTSLLGSYSAAQRDDFIDVYQRDLPPRY